MQRTLIIVILLASHSVFGQEKQVAQKIDDLRIEWDAEAEKLQTYEGLGSFCSISRYRNGIVKMLDEIHHYDTLLYGIVIKKFDATKDKEAEATIADIQKLESKYTTAAFKSFIHAECNTYNEIERNYGKEKGKAYDKEVEKLQKELSKYVQQITERIDLIDEHVHHLHLGE